MIAILSDIHGNLEALEAVLADVASFNVDAVYCLGDIIGYGPDPISCIQHAMMWQIVLQGNFDHAAIGNDDLPGWSGAVHARKTILRFRSQLAQHPNRSSITDFLTSRPTYFVTVDAFHVHGSPRNHLHEYLFPEDIYNDRKMDAITSLFDSLCLCGHTHLPGIFQRKSSGWDYVTPEECGYQYSIAEDKLICNVGSVGQPRDNDSRACYVLFTPHIITFRRVEYDIDRTIQKMRDEGDDDFHGQRLFEGR